ncbi:MAG TPA: hypothetical protein VN777_04025 [Terriglobales bacterium]|nr:hypothetical protein [Terriglobales bacterium]
MKLRSLAVITLLVLGCSAAFGQNYSFGFLSYDKTIQYCDYEVLTVTPPLAAGVHNIQACPGGTSGNGIMVGVATTDLKDSSRSPVTGNAYAFADNAIEVGYNGGFACGCAVLYITKLKAATGAEKKAGAAYGWELYYSLDPGYEFFGTYGFLTKKLGGSGKATYDVAR